MTAYQWTPDQLDRAERMIKAGGAWLRYRNKTFRIWVIYDAADDCYESDPYGGDTGPIAVDLRDFDPDSLSVDDSEPLHALVPGTASVARLLRDHRRAR